MRGLASVFLVVSTVSCASHRLDIAGVLQEGRHIDGRRVQVTGEVAGSPQIGPSGATSYEITDGTGTLSVTSRLDPPTRCHTIRVKGKVRSVFTAETNSHRPGKVYRPWWTGLAIEEESREDLGLSPKAKIFVERPGHFHPAVMPM